MGTRHLIVVKKDNTEKVCQYGQWDGSLSGQGQTVYNFCKSKRKIKKLKAVLDKVILGEENFESACIAYNFRVNLNTRTAKDFYWYENFISRDVGGDILQHIIDCNFEILPEEFEGKLGILKYRNYDKLVNYNDISIEYAYIIDLDNNKLEVWAYGEKIKDCDLNNMPTEIEFLKEKE